jgi:Flp pilus assembly protein TadB
VCAIRQPHRYLAHSTGERSEPLERPGAEDRVTVEEDRASDRRIAVAFGAVLLVEVVLAGMADAGTFPLWVWLVLSIVAVLVAGLVFAMVQARAEGTPVWRRRTRR